MGIRTGWKAERHCKVREGGVNSQTKTLMYPRLAELDSQHERTYCGLKELFYRFDSITVIQDTINKTDGHLSSLVRMNAVDYINEYIKEVEASSKNLFNRITETMDTVCKKVDDYLEADRTNVKGSFTSLFEKLVYNPFKEQAEKRKIEQLKDNLHYDDLLFKREYRTSTRQAKKESYLSNPNNK